MRAGAVPGLNPQQQIECTLEGALVCHRLGLRRKYALFLYVAALLNAENENFAVAHALVSVVEQLCKRSRHITYILCLFVDPLRMQPVRSRVLGWQDDTTAAGDRSRGIQRRSRYRIRSILCHRNCNYFGYGHDTGLYC